MEAPVTRYASTALGDIAYQVVGDGPIDLLLVNPMSRCIDMLWDYDPSAEMLQRLARGCRLILFDRRGCGISDPLPADLPPTWEDWLDDMLAVLDDVGARDVVLLAERDAASASLLFASSHPERVRALVLGNTSARFRVAPGYPAGERHERAAELAAVWEQYWGTEKMIARTRPALAGDPAYVRWMMRMQRTAYSPRRAGAEFRYIINFDARAVLNAISVPTLIMHRQDFDVVPVAHGRYLAEHIRGARLELLPGSDMDVLLPGDDEPLALIESFLADTRKARSDGTALTTILLADVPDEDRLVANLGSLHWNEWRSRRRTILQEALRQFHGRAVMQESNDLMVSFDGPARALRFAQSLRKEMRDRMQIEIRIGLHTGECVRTGGRLDGEAVQIGQDVLRAAKPGEVLASVEVRDLTAGSGIEFHSIGVHQLGGDAGERELFALEG
ncbi:MAG TPA: adenylate/guanylate cyclase domain-containing protein [Rhodanobacteraceae bacterium]|jgi:pimeloyl-ACP methyl ester carboxylesterase|nr:adenylate/guanylate cyclase domain-containing protein [Rhodanobacteraceae bacterium]